MLDRVISAHVTHRWANIDELEPLLAMDDRKLLRSVVRLGGVEEAVVLKTCNRFEIYISSSTPERTHRELERLLVSMLPDQTVRFLSGADSAAHLMRVACGLDAMIVGEEQVLHQVKEAYEFARRSGSVNGTLSPLFQRALHAGKEARSRTRISRGPVSAGSAAVELAERLLETLKGKTVLVIGAGEMASLVARSLAAKHPGALFIANRTQSHAERLAKELGGRAVPYGEMGSYIPGADVVICAAGAPHPLLTRGQLEDALARQPRRRKLLIIDISIPRNIEEGVGSLPRVELHNLDGLRKIAEENLERRRGEVAKVEGIISAEVERLVSAERGALVRELHRRVALLKERELGRALRRLNGAGERERRIVAELADALAAKILAAPTEGLKRASREGDMAVLEAAARLFGIVAQKK